MTRDETLRKAAEAGLLPEDMMEAFDDWSDALALRVAAGEITYEEAERLTDQRAQDDAREAFARGWPKGKARELMDAKKRLVSE